MMLIWITIYGTMVIGSLGEPGPEPNFSFRHRAVKVSKAVNLSRMKDRIGGMLGGKTNDKSKTTVNPKFKSFDANAELQERDKRDVVENNRWEKILRPRSIEEVTEAGEQPSIPSSTEVNTPSTKMSHIMRIEPRERRSDLQSGENHIRKRETPQTERLTEQKAPVTASSSQKPPQNTSSTVKQGETTLAAKLEEDAKPPSSPPSSGKTNINSSDNNMSSTPTQATSASAKDAHDYSQDYHALDYPDTKGTKETIHEKRKGPYTYRPEFFRHKNFFRGVPTEEEKKYTTGPEKKKTSSATTPRETATSRGSDARETRHWQEERKLEDKKDYDTSINLDIRYLGGNDLPIPPVGSIKPDSSKMHGFDGLQVKQNLGKDGIVAAVPAESLSSQNNAHFCIIVVISLLFLRF